MVADTGDIFVADGHGADINNRVVKFSKNGTFIKAWGQTGYGPGEFRTLRTIALDSRGQIFVGDRSNNRIQIFDQEGNFLTMWTQFGRPSGIFFNEHDHIYVADSESDDEQRQRVRGGDPARATCRSTSESARSRPSDGCRAVPRSSETGGCDILR